MFSLIGWAYDMKTVPAEMVAKRALRTGDGTHCSAAAAAAAATNIYGWTDGDLPEEDRRMAQVYKKSE